MCSPVTLLLLTLIKVDTSGSGLQNRHEVLLLLLLHRLLDLLDPVIDNGLALRLSNLVMYLVFH